MSKHHEFSPSSLERRMLCPASFKLEQSLPPNVDNDDAMEGTLLHEAVATGDFSKLESEEQRELVQQCRDFADVATGGDWQAEVKVRLFDKDYSILTEGTVDVVKINGKEGVIIDWKFGRNPVDYAVDNIQLAAYACALMITKNLESCTVYLAQPRLKLMTSHTFTNAEAIRDNIRLIIEACKDSNAEFCTGEKQCRYCKGSLQGGCPALVESAELLTSEPLVVETEEVIKQVSGEQLTAFMLASAPISKAREAVKAELKARCMMADGSYGNWRVKSGSKTRDCQDLNGLHEATSSVIEVESYLKQCKVSVAGVERLYSERLKANGEVKTLKAGKEMFAEIANSLITYKVSAPTLEYVADAVGVEMSPSAEGESLSTGGVLSVGDSVAISQ